MNGNVYMAHKKHPHKTLRVHSARYTQCIDVGCHKLKLPETFLPVKYKHDAVSDVTTAQSGASRAVCNVMVTQERDDQAVCDVTTTQLRA